MLRRFVLAGVAFVALIIPGTFGLALLAAPAAPTAVIEPPACEQSLRNAGDTLAALQAQLAALARADRAQQCSATKLYFLAAVRRGRWRRFAGAGLTANANSAASMPTWSASTTASPRNACPEAAAPADG